ncbi:MAG: type III pantothenate kinase [Pseudomonadota bacterium]|nr:type III pantothenate kinase [Pseudomonadota bacterium]
MRQLWLDLGNTRLKYWLTEQQEQLEHGAELHLQSPADLLLGLTDRFVGFAVTRVLISSVLDSKANQRIQHALARLNVPIEFAKVLPSCQGLQTGYDDPHKLGIDRWLQVLALAGQGKKYVIVGCGTALTIDLLDHQEHLGGYILPSLYLQREALASGTRRVQVPEGAFDNLLAGRCTEDAVHHGILLGLVGAVEKILRHDPQRQLILTGGDAPLLASFIEAPNGLHIRENLLLEGLMRYFSEG